MATLTTAWANMLYNLVNKGTAPTALSNSVFLRLFTADPTLAGSFTNEVTGGSYTGQNIATAMPVGAGGVGASTAVVTFNNMPAATVTHWAKCRTAAGKVNADEMIEKGALAAPVTVGAGEPLVFAIGDLTGSAS